MIYLSICVSRLLQFYWCWSCRVRLDHWFAGSYRDRAPSSVMAGQLLSDSTIYGFSEQSNLTLLAALNVGITTPGTWVCCNTIPGGTLPAGETIDSYLLRAAPATNSGELGYRDFQGTITFSPGEKIVGIIIGYANIAYTDGLLGRPARLTLHRVINLGVSSMAISWPSHPTASRCTWIFMSTQVPVAWT